MVNTQYRFVWIWIGICLQGSVCNGLGYIFTIITFSTLYNITKFFEFETVYVDKEDAVTKQMWVFTDPIVTAQLKSTLVSR